MTGVCDGRVVVISGTAGGLGRVHALAFARHGARLVINDYTGGATHDSPEPQIDDVADEISAIGAEVVINRDDVADWDGAQRLIAAAVDTYGTLDVLVNNAGILRDRMLVNMSLDEWDAVLRVHLGGTFCSTRHAAAYWRDRSKAGESLDARVINPTSASGLYGNATQSNYSAAKAAVTSLTVVAALELARYGVKVNAIAPTALTRMTGTMGRFKDAYEASKTAPDEFFEDSPAHVSPLVVWLASPAAIDISSRVFNIRNRHIDIATHWGRGPGCETTDRWTVDEIGKVLPGLLAIAPVPEPIR